MVILLGIFSASILWDSDTFPKSINKVKFFFSTMWFLAPISAQPLTNFSMKLGTTLIKSIDQGWMEIAGGQGAFVVAKRTALANQRTQIKLFNFLILSMIYLLFILVFIRAYLGSLHLEHSTEDAKEAFVAPK